MYQSIDIKKLIEMYRPKQWLSFKQYYYDERLKELEDEEPRLCYQAYAALCGLAYFLQTGSQS